METDPTLWLPHSCFRVPHWRWLRAQHLARRGRRPDPGIDDRWVLHARASATGGRKAKPAAVRAARAVWEGDPAERRWELEARLLTDEPLGRVADRCGLPPAVAEAYAEVFFSVRPHRQATDWLLLQAVGYSPVTGFNGPQPGGVWKYLAVRGGPVVLDVVIAATTGRPLPEGGAGGPPAAETDQLRQQALLLVGLLTARSDGEVAAVVEARRRLRAVEAGRGQGYEVSPALAQMEEFAIALPWLRKKGRPPGRAGAKGTKDAKPSARPSRVKADVDPAVDSASCR
jgi:hypothetical protein